MKLLIPLILFLSFACSEEEVKPCFDCTTMKVVRDQAYDSWQIIYKNKPDIGTLAQVNQWQIENEAAKGTYLKLEELIAKNCYNYETKSDFD